MPEPLGSVTAMVPLNVPNFLTVVRILLVPVVVVDVVPGSPAASTGWRPGISSASQGSQRVIVPERWCSVTR